MTAMKHPILKTHIVFFSLVTLLSACAGGGENSATSNSNSAEQANSNSQPAVAGNSPDASNNGTPLAVQPIPAPGSPPQPASPPPAAVKAPAPNKADAAKPAPAGNGAAPKLIAPAKRLEFGKQPQDKTLVRAIVIRNGGRANLNVESVTPS